MKKPSTKINHNSIPKQVELFGRTITTVDDSERLTLTRNFGEARYGLNRIALNRNGTETDELKLTYLHEMLHFILNFTGYQGIIQNGGKIELEQFIELMASAIYQYEKTAKF